MAKSGLEYSVVVPVYHGAPYLESLCRRLTEVFKKISPDYEILLVDDGSTDKSWEVMQGLRAQDEKIKLLRLERNFGQHNATLCGLSYCEGNYVITMDDDLQHPPEEIPKLIAEIHKGYQLVYGQYDRKRHSWFRNKISTLGNKVLKKVTGTPFKLTSLRAIQGELVKKIQGLPYPDVIVDLWFMRFVSKKDISSCAIRHEESRTSNYSLKKLFQVALSMFWGHPAIAPKIAALKRNPKPPFVVRQALLGSDSPKVHCPCPS